MNPFDLPGPQFLALYAAMVLAGVVLAFIVRRKSRTPSHDLLEDPRLNPYEVAHLAGGAPATVNAALARLVNVKALDLDDKGASLHRGGGEYKPVHPLESAILGTAGEAFKVKEVREAAALEVGHIRKRLEDLDLEMNDEKRRTAGCLPALVLLFIVVLGIVKIAVGVSRNKPIEFLGIEVGVLALAAVLIFAIRPKRTIRGDRYLERLRLRHAALKTTAGAAPATLQGDDLSMAVGLFGVGVLAGGPMMSLQRALTPPANAGGWGGDAGGCGGGGGGADGGGGGCGGGGGGGGCGGCGGGGGGD
jgi:uncharacterized protein (TIGR04222 family)